MNRLILFILIGFAFTTCKKDERDPVAELAAITGTWKPIARTSSDFVTTPVTNPEPDVIEFRYDGVMLNKNGFRPCCTPLSYTVNGIYMNIKPQAPAELDPVCATASCLSCQNFQVMQDNPDELITYCNGFSTRFVREK